MNWLNRIVNSDLSPAGCHVASVRIAKLLFTLAAAALAILLPASRGWAQGCIVSRSSQPVIGPVSSFGNEEESDGPGGQRRGGEGGYLGSGKWQVTIGYRHQFSFRHFVGPVEQVRRQQNHSQVMNKMNLFNVNLSYQATPRWSFSADVPVLFATRRGQSSPYTTAAQGVGDIILTAQSWIWRPPTESAGNVAVGFGVMLPTGRSNVKNTVDNGTDVVTIPVDYSIQPGQGGWGIVGQVQAFKAVSKAVLYFDASYIATPQSVNGTFRGGTNPLTQYNSISDQYLAEAGIAYPISRIRGLSLTFGPRDEGVPVRDIFGESLGFRRPGFAISVEPGFEYARGKSIYTFGIGKAVYRTRERSVSDFVSGGHGDAAFADWVWLANYTYRF
jgi:hypothetical protein